MFKTRLGILALIFGLAFLLVIGRLWQLQIIRYAQYDALATRNQNARLTIGARASILDRYGEVLAEDQASYDLAVRADRLILSHVNLAEVKAVRKAAQDAIQACPEGPAAAETLQKIETTRQAQLDALEQKLRQDPFVTALAAALKRDKTQVSTGVLKALDAVARGWAGESTPVRIISGVDEQTWLGLRATHEDAFRDSHQMFGKAADKMDDAAQPAFPGLVCTLSMHRAYPHGALASSVLGALREITPEEEDDLRNDALLLDNAAAPAKTWARTLEHMDAASLKELERLLHADPREIEDIAELHQLLTGLSSADRATLAGLGLEPVALWAERPPLMQLSETERLCLSGQGPLVDRIIGEQGVERWYNDHLRGHSGGRKRGAAVDDEAAENDAHGPKEGQTLALTISLAWQRAVENALKSQECPGAAVVVDVNTGEVLALANWPDFDPNLFAPPRFEHQEKLQALLQDPRKPLLNRAIYSTYPLGSVMKTLVAAVALERGVVTPQEQLECRGFLKEGNQIYHCDEGRSHGLITLVKAIRRSCNVYFYQVGARLGVETLSPYAHLFFGRKTGIDLPGESAGVYPDRAWRNLMYPNNPAARAWSKGHDYHLAIGQGDFRCTVLQVAMLMAAVANGGTVYTPRVWLDAPAGETRTLNVQPANLALVRQGLEEVVNFGPMERGTAYTCFHEHGELPIRVAGKTSTAQHVPGHPPHAWFAGYAPVDHPQVAFAVILEEGGHGGATAAPVAYKFLKEMYPKNGERGVKSGE